MNNGNGFAINDSVANFIRNVRKVGIPGDGNIFSRPWRLWHRLNYAVAGATNFTFFNEAQSPGVTNLQQPSTLPANYGFIATGLRFSFLQGIDRSGAQVSATRAKTTLNLSVGATNATEAINDVALWHEKTRALFCQGNVKFSVSDRPIIDVWGLDAFPSGRGVVTSSAVANALEGTAAATNLQHVLSQVTNGAPIISNVHRFHFPTPILAGQQFSVNVTYPTAVAFDETTYGPLASGSATYAGTLMCELEGELICPSTT